MGFELEIGFIDHLQVVKNFEIRLVAGRVQLGQLGTAATDWPIVACTGWFMMMENLVEWRLAGETELLGENPPLSHFVHHKSHLTRPGIEPRKPATNRLSYGAAWLQVVTTNNYNTIVNFHTLQITTVSAKSFQSAVSSPVIPLWQLLTVKVPQLPYSLRHCLSEYLTTFCTELNSNSPFGMD
jgi:hypothetical protein